MSKKRAQSTGLILLRKVKDNRGGFAKTLSTDERREAVAALIGPDGADVYSRGKRHRWPLTQMQMAELFQVTRSTICNDLAAFRKALGHLVTKEDQEAIIGDLAHAKVISQRMAAKGDDWALYWRVEHEYIQALQRLGVVIEAPLRVDGNIGLTHAFAGLDAGKAEVLLRIAARDRHKGGRRPTAKPTAGATKAKPKEPPKRAKRKRR